MKVRLRFESSKVCAVGLMSCDVASRTATQAAIADAIIPDFTKFAEFTLTIEDAKEYIYSLSTKRRVYNRTDIEARLYI